MALVHVLDLQSKFHEVPYLGFLYLGLILGALAAAGALVMEDSRRAWAGALVLAGATLVGYAFSRSTGLPSATDDIGNWLEPLGLASLFVETCVVVLSAFALRTQATAAVVDWTDDRVAPRLS